MVEGKINYEDTSFVMSPNVNNRNIKDTHVIIKASKMNIL